MELVKSFTFDAAHYMPEMAEGHPYRRTHGHSFRVEVEVRGAPTPPHGWVADLGEIGAAAEEIKSLLDHSLLNEIEGLERPTLEALCVWIADRMRSRAPGLARVTVARPSVGEACTYRLSGAE
ncbi:MAG: 6-pyruvoyl tetrahydropterin synthase family protein [Pseudomonadota bacterium]